MLKFDIMEHGGEKADYTSTTDFVCMSVDVCFSANRF